MFFWSSKKSNRLTFWSFLRYFTFFSHTQLPILNHFFVWKISLSFSKVFQVWKRKNQVVVGIATIIIIITQIWIIMIVWSTLSWFDWLTTDNYYYCYEQQPYTIIIDSRSSKRSILSLIFVLFQLSVRSTSSFVSSSVCFLFDKTKQKNPWIPDSRIDKNLLLLKQKKLNKNL